MFCGLGPAYWPCSVFSKFAANTVMKRKCSVINEEDVIKAVKCCVVAADHIDVETLNAVS